MKALKFDGSLKFTSDAPVPAREGETLVQVICAGICNTDIEITKGYAGFQGTPGHEFVGRVVESPDKSLLGRRVAGEINVGCNQCALCLAGDARHCAARTVLGIKDRDGAFAEYVSLPARNLIHVPDSLSDEEAVFIEPLAAACQILEQVNIDASSKVAVIGDGKLAQLIVQVLAQTGCDLIVVGKHESKLELLAGVTAHRYRIDGEGNRAQDFPGAQSANNYDVVVDATGSASGLSMALTLVKPRGTVVLKSTHHKETCAQMSQVVVNEVTVVGSRCGRFRPAIDLLTSGVVDVRPLISERFPIEEGLRAFEKASEKSTMKVLLDINS